ncbi:MAG: hypothetical protein PHC29_04755 [Candidatus Omnitrophica bacterium]|nr:hypothetical protein [Candidatus Omnitrophota bacterium]
MDNKDNPKWYFKNWSLVVSFLCVGPFMLPLVWVNPHLSKKAKIIITTVILILTFLLVVVSLKSLKTINDYYQSFSI